VEPEALAAEPEALVAEPEASAAELEALAAEPEASAAEQEALVAEASEASAAAREESAAGPQVRPAERQAQRVGQPQAPREGSAVRQEAARVAWPAERAQAGQRPTDQRTQEVLADPMAGTVLRSPPSSRARSLPVSGRRFRVRSRRVPFTPLAVDFPVRR